MGKELTKKDIEDGRKISEIFSSISDTSKNMVISYMSALRDKEIADSFLGEPAEESVQCVS